MIKRKILFKTMIAGWLAALFLITGCDILPPPISMIEPPEYPEEVSLDMEDPKAIARRFLDQSTQLIYPIRPNGKDAVIEFDLENDGKNEFVVLYKGIDWRTGSELFGAFLLKNSKNKWEKTEICKYNKKIVSLDWADVKDITGDGVPEVLIGYNSGYLIGCDLDVYSLKEGLPKIISSIGYDELYIEDIKWHSDNDNKPKFIVLKRDDTRNYILIREVLRWDNMEEGFVPAKEVYPIYYKNVIKDLKERLERYDMNYYEWYLLADAQIKSGIIDESLYSSGRALKRIEKYNELHGFDSETMKYETKSLIVKGEALIADGGYLEGIDILDSVKTMCESDSTVYSQDDIIRTYLDLGIGYMRMTKLNQDSYGKKALLIKSKESFEKAIKIIETSYPAQSSDLALKQINIYKSHPIKNELNNLLALCKTLGIDIN